MSLSNKTPAEWISLFQKITPNPEDGVLAYESAKNAQAAIWPSYPHDAVIEAYFQHLASGRQVLTKYSLELLARTSIRLQFSLEFIMEHFQSYL